MNNASAYTKPLPRPDPELKPFWDFARLGQFAAQRCRDCAHVHFPPGPVCPACLSSSQEWFATSGRGTLFSWVAFHHPYWDCVKPALPYNVVMVQLEEGPLIASNLVDENLQGLKLGMAVEAVFEAIPGDMYLPKFKLRAR
ncbi:MAG: Zn-ribbon domain-containing OB-fold protein [Burkholderiales bacterium]|nr:Zn-ribbon domain-containing OB-fold protein [Burkholderiales bacterium]